jgi:hypothetical protein
MHVMTALNAINGVAASADPGLIDGLLRNFSDSWNFSGLGTELCPDCGALDTDCFLVWSSQTAAGKASGDRVASVRMGARTPTQTSASAAKRRSAQL